MPRLRKGSALVTEVSGGGFRRISDRAWSRETVDGEGAYPSIHYSGARMLRGRPYDVWKVGDQYFAQAAQENPVPLLVILGIGAGAAAAIGAGYYFATRPATTAAATKPATTPASTTPAAPTNDGGGGGVNLWASGGPSMPATAIRQNTTAADQAACLAAGGGKFCNPP